MKTNLKQYLPEIRVISTANPDGTYREYKEPINPSGKAQWRNGSIWTPIKNAFRKDRALIEEAGVIIEMASKKLKEAKNG